MDLIKFRILILSYYWGKRHKNTRSLSWPSFSLRIKVPYHVCNFRYVITYEWIDESKVRLLNMFEANWGRWREFCLRYKRKLIVEGRRNKDFYPSVLHDCITWFLCYRSVFLNWHENETKCTKQAKHSIIVVDLFYWFSNFTEWGTILVQLLT
jgi:hypothetical protein